MRDPKHMSKDSEGHIALDIQESFRLSTHNALPIGAEGTISVPQTLHMVTRSANLLILVNPWQHSNCKAFP
jgi:hypothetical protein